MTRRGLFQYGCYVSYRRNQPIVERFVADLAQGLSFELAPLLDLAVFVDRLSSPKVTGGAHFEKTIADAMCRSVCMIVVFTPTYFSESHPYCAREFRAMEQIETKRMSHLGAKKDGYGLIIPVVLRGADQLPVPLKHRQFLNFDRYMLGDHRIYRSPGFQTSIRTIAEYIYDRYREFEQHQLDLDEECEGFRLPSTEEVLLWLRSSPVMARQSSFPIRSPE